MSVFGLIYFLAGIALLVFTNSHAPEKAFTGTVTWVLQPEAYYTLVILSAFLSLFGLYEIFTKIIGKKKEGVLLSIETKKCPACAESIKIEARVCKYCGYKFSEDKLIQQNEERGALIKQDQRTQINRITFPILGIMIIVIGYLVLIYYQRSH